MGHTHKVSKLDVLHTVTRRAHLLVDLVSTTNTVEQGNEVMGGGGGRSAGEGGREERDWHAHLWWSRALKRPL